MASSTAKTTDKKAKVPRAKSVETLPFSEKLVLNQWLISLFGIDPLAVHMDQGRKVRPLYALTKTLLACREGIAQGVSDPEVTGFHYFYSTLKSFLQDKCRIHPEALLQYENNIVTHTRWLNESRERPIEWKYYQWLSLLFTEVYLDRYFTDPQALLDSLNYFLDRFNAHWAEKLVSTGIGRYTAEELNKLCLQNATGSGKTLLMHVNYRQFVHYAKQHGKSDSLTSTLLITPNESLSEQHEAEMRQSGIAVGRLFPETSDLLSNQHGHLSQIDFTEITKLGDKAGPTTIAMSQLKDQNLIFVDEGHRGMGKAEEDGWYMRRAMLTERGFAFEYSATFREAVNAAGSAKIEQAYAKAVLFDYSYKYFYEDGYGKDYRIFNIPKSQEDVEFLYLTGCLLSFYQQLALYDERKAQYAEYNLEKPLWVFVGSSVSGSKKQTAEELETVADIGKVLGFYAQFLAKPDLAKSAVQKLLTLTGTDTGLISNGQDIFYGAFAYLVERQRAGMSADALQTDILARLFNNPAGGQLQGQSGELVLKAGEGQQHFGLINVGDAMSLAKHVEDLVKKALIAPITVTDSDFLAAQFNTVKESSSPINVLVGAKKFVEGWDCWRVSTLGLMRVGRTEGSQIIQLFGRGVRLKGWQWSLKRSSHARPMGAPQHIRLIETLNVFGVQADFMEKFRKFLEDEGLPTNDDKLTMEIPMNVTHDFGQKLKIIRPRTKDGTGREYSFSRDGVMPQLGDVPEYITKNKVEVDWYPKISAILAEGVDVQAGAKIVKNESHFSAQHIAFMDMARLYFELEKYKARENLYSLIIQPAQLVELLRDGSWYTLLVPKDLMKLEKFSSVSVWNAMALELLKKYCTRLFNYKRDEFIKPRLHVVDLDAAHANLPQDKEFYTITVDASEDVLIKDIDRLKAEIDRDRHAKKRKWLIEGTQLKACILSNHLYQPLLSVKSGGGVSVSPVALNESETDFVSAFMGWLDRNEDQLAEEKTAIYLLRNKSRGSGIGFFEAGNFYPDFILWAVTGKQQNVVFVEPHGMSREGPASAKVQFHKTIKEIESRLPDPHLRLESAIVTLTDYSDVQHGLTKKDWNGKHVFFMKDLDAQGLPVFIESVMGLIR
jgi:Type III restriction enzyme, res subunit